LQAEPIIRTIHALCVEVIGEELRMLLPHEVDAMIYDLLHEYPEVAALYDGFDDAGQALRDHDAGHTQHLILWMAAQQWLVRHKAHLVGDLPRLLLERLRGGDVPERAYGYVVVDESQDLTSGEQELMFRLRRPGGQLVALGGPRQSIYKLRGNDPQGLAKIEARLGDGSAPLDVSITECQRCPKAHAFARTNRGEANEIGCRRPATRWNKEAFLGCRWSSPEGVTEVLLGHRLPFFFCD